MPLTVNQNSCFISLLSAFRLTLSPPPTLQPSPLSSFTGKTSQRVCSIAWDYWVQCECMERPHDAGVEAEAWCVSRWRAASSTMRFLFQMLLIFAKTIAPTHHRHQKHIYRLTQAQTLAPAHVPLQLESPWALHASWKTRRTTTMQCPTSKNTSIFFSLKKGGCCRYKKTVSPKHQQCLQLYCPAIRSCNLPTLQKNVTSNFS